MSDDESGLETTEDRLILDLLDELALSGSVDVGDAEVCAERRAYLEVLGLLPYDLEEAEAQEQSRERLLAALPPAEAAKVAAFPASPHVPDQRRRWLLPIAASLLVALFAYSSWQHRELAEQKETIEALAADLNNLDRAGADLASLRDELDVSRSRVAMATSRGAEICMLKPFGERPIQPAAAGALVIAAERDRWFLRIHGLEPCAGGCTYKVWFETDSGVVPSVEFHMGPACTEFEHSSTEVPQGLKAVIVTIEPEEGAETPTGQRVLFADQAMLLL